MANVWDWFTGKTGEDQIKKGYGDIKKGLESNYNTNKDSSGTYYNPAVSELQGSTKKLTNSLTKQNKQNKLTAKDSIASMLAKTGNYDTNAIQGAVNKTNRGYDDSLQQSIGQLNMQEKTAMAKILNGLQQAKGSLEYSNANKQLQSLMSYQSPLSKTIGLAVQLATGGSGELANQLTTNANLKKQGQDTNAIAIGPILLKAFSSLATGGK